MSKGAKGDVLGGAGEGDDDDSDDDDESYEGESPLTYGVLRRHDTFTHSVLFMLCMT